MILHVECRAAGDRWRVRVAETGFIRDVPNVVTFNHRGEVTSIGDEPRVSGADVARVAPIYDALRFDPLRTASVIWYHTRLAHHEVRRGLAHVLDLFDRYDLVLELPGYEEIAPDARQRFEKDLYDMTFLRSYAINGRKRSLPWNILRFS